jgi:hypothetical protein
MNTGILTSILVVLVGTALMVLAYLSYLYGTEGYGLHPFLAAMIGLLLYGMLIGYLCFPDAGSECRPMATKREP